jgi:plastocyanin
MRRFERSFMASLAAGVGAALLMVGCGSGNSNTGGGNAASNPPVVTASAAGTKVTATEVEYSITLSATAFTPGVYTFVVENHGTMSHDLTIAGPGVAQQASPTVQPGGSGQVTVTLQTGTYELWCSIDNHKAMGMDLKIQVT